MQRKFNCSDKVFLMESERKMAYFTRDKADFEAMNSLIFGADFLMRWKTTLAKAAATADHTDLLHEQTLSTEAVKKLLHQSHLHFQVLKAYIRIAFPKNKAMYSAFGFYSYENIRKSPWQAVLLMKKVYALSVEYAENLAVVGWTAQRRHHAKTTWDELEKVLEQQQLLKAARPTYTTMRINYLNEAYNFMVLVCRFGKLLYKNDPVRQKQYRITFLSSAEPFDTL